MRLLLIALTFACLVGCNKNVRISNENAIVLFQAQQQMATDLINNEEVKSALSEVGTPDNNPLKTIDAIRAIATSGEKALIPVRDYMQLEAEFLWMGGDPVKADVTPEQVVASPQSTLATVDFRTKMANQDVKHHWMAKIVNNPYVAWGGGIVAIITTLASTYLGVSKFKGLKTLAQTAMAEAEQHRQVAKNAIHYAKDIEEVASDETIKGEALKTKIRDTRLNSMTSQHKNGIAETMDAVMGEVKRERI